MENGEVIISLDDVQIWAYAKFGDARKRIDTICDDSNARLIDRGLFNFKLSDCTKPFTIINEKTVVKVEPNLKDFLNKPILIKAYKRGNV